MIEVPEGFRVRLIRDYTRYHRALRVGLEGRTTIPTGRCASGKNQFLRIQFWWKGGVVVPEELLDPKTGKTILTGRRVPVPDADVKIAIDVLRCDVEVVDERWQEWQGRESKEREDALASHVSKATIYTTRRGGFVELVVQYNNGRLNDTWKKKTECKQIVADLEKRGLLEEAIRGQGD